jgi:hypothetical protein
VFMQLSDIPEEPAADAASAKGAAQ